MRDSIGSVQPSSASYRMGGEWAGSKCKSCRCIEWVAMEKIWVELCSPRFDHVPVPTMECSNPSVFFFCRQHECVDRDVDFLFSYVTLVIGSFFGRNESWTEAGYGNSKQVRLIYKIQKIIIPVSSGSLKTKGGIRYEIFCSFGSNEVLGSKTWTCITCNFVTGAVDDFSLRDAAIFVEIWSFRFLESTVTRNLSTFHDRLEHLRRWYHEFQLVTITKRLM